MRDFLRGLTLPFRLLPCLAAWALWIGVGLVWSIPFWMVFKFDAIDFWIATKRGDPLEDPYAYQVPREYAEIHEARRFWRRGWRGIQRFFLPARRPAESA